MPKYRRSVRLRPGVVGGSSALDGNGAARTVRAISTSYARAIEATASSRKRAVALNLQRLIFGDAYAGVVFVASLDGVRAVQDDRRVAKASNASPLAVAVRHLRSFANKALRLVGARLR